MPLNLKPRLYSSRSKFPELNEFYLNYLRCSTINDLSILIFEVFLAHELKTWSICLHMFRAGFAKKAKFNFSQVFKFETFNYIHITFPNRECHNSHNWFKQTQTRKLFSQINIETWSVHFLSIKNVWLVHNDSRSIQISYQNKTSPSAESNREFLVPRTKTKSRCVLNFYASFVGLLKNNNFLFLRRSKNNIIDLVEKM